METNKQLISKLNDLVRINKDRVEGYTKAITELKEEETELKELFQKFAEESDDFAEELQDIIQAELGGNPTEDTTLSGKVYRAWMEFNNNVRGNDTAAIIDKCEFGEDAAQKEYLKALEAGDSISSELYAVIKDQQESLKEAHDQVRALRGRFTSVK